MVVGRRAAVAVCDPKTWRIFARGCVHARGLSLLYSFEAAGARSKWILGAVFRRRLTRLALVDVAAV